MCTVKSDQTPVWTAAFNGHVDVVEFLVVKANADPNKPDKVLGSVECAWGRRLCACVRLFDTSAACVICFQSVNMCTYVGWMTSTVKTGATPVCAAAQEGHLNVVKFLTLKANADPNKPREVFGIVECAWGRRLCACVRFFVTSAACVIYFETAHYFACQL